MRAHACVSSRRDRAALTVAGGVAVIPAIDLLRGASLVVRAAGISGGAAQWLARFDTTGFETRDLEVPSRHGTIRARLYRPVRGQSRTLVLTPGVHAEGIDEPRLMKFAGDLAASGAGVLTPELPDLLRYEITRAAARPDRGRRPVGGRRQDPLAGRTRGARRHQLLRRAVADRRGPAPPPRRGRRSCCPSAATATSGASCTSWRPGIQPDGVVPPAARLRRRRRAAELRATGSCPRDQVDALKAGVRVFMKASHVDMFDKAAAPARSSTRAIAMEAGLPSPARETAAHGQHARRARSRGVARAGHRLGRCCPPRCPPSAHPRRVAPVYLLHGADDVVIPSQESERLAASLPGAWRAGAPAGDAADHARGGRPAGDAARGVRACALLDADAAGVRAGPALLPVRRPWPDASRPVHPIIVRRRAAQVHRGDGRRSLAGAAGAAAFIPGPRRRAAPAVRASVNSRHWPGLQRAVGDRARWPRARAATTGCPTASHMRRTCRLRPSWMPTSMTACSFAPGYAFTSRTSARPGLLAVEHDAAGEAWRALRATECPPRARGTA